jgi:uncharacterized membrane protein YbaN (DUF454 family)
MLLNHKWFGPPLQEWQKTHTIQRHIKYRIMALIVISFSISIAILSDKLNLQLVLIFLGLGILIFIAQIKEPEENLK